MQSVWSEVGSGLVFLIDAISRELSPTGEESERHKVGLQMGVLKMQVINLKSEASRIRNFFEYMTISRLF
jgi:hypothetical protein